MTTRLKIRGIPFTLFYDYDQLKTGNLTKLDDNEKVQWFGARHEHVFLRPQRAFWVDEHPFRKLLASIHPGYRRVLSAKLVMFGGLTNACEAMGSFIIPAYTGNNKNWKRFERFVLDYMHSWNVPLQMPGGGTPGLVRVLWDNYRNGIAHGFQVEGGGIEYLPPGTRLSLKTGWLRVCPSQFLADYEAGVNNYLAKVSSGGAPLQDFLTRFRAVYPC